MKENELKFKIGDNVYLKHTKKSMIVDSFEMALHLGNPNAEPDYTGVVKTTWFDNGKQQRGSCSQDALELVPDKKIMYRK